MRVRDWLCASISRRSVALELEDEALALWLTARDGAVNVAIIVCLCYIVEVWQGPDFYFANEAMASLLTRRQFLPSNNASISEERLIGMLPPDYSSISSAEMAWDWLHSCILPAFAVAEPRVLLSNQLLGKVRLRQLRVRDGTCNLKEMFDGVFAECYGPYSPDNENTDRFGPEGTTVSTASAWQWSSAESLGGDSFVGEVNNYGGGGFYADIPRDLERAKALLQELRAGRWIDEATRMVFVDINMYNPDHNVFVLVNVYLEIPPTAGILPRVTVNTLKLLNDEFCSVTAHVMLLVLSLWTVFMQAAEMASRGLKGYVCVMAHYLHAVAMVAGVVLSLVGIVYNCRDPEAYDDPALVAVRSDEFVDLLSERYSYDIYRYLVVMLLFLSCGRLLFLSDFGQRSKLTATLQRSLVKMTSFSFMFLILMSSFSMLAYLVFGTDLYDFRNFSSSFSILIEVIIGSLDYKSLSTTNRFLGPLFYMAFIFFVVFVLYNMFIVILNDTYFSVRQEAAKSEEVEMYEVFTFVRHCVINLLRWARFPIALRGVPPPPPARVVKLRSLRTLLLDWKVPRRAVADLMMQLSGAGRPGRHSAFVDREQARLLAARATEGLWEEPASWEDFVDLLSRLNAIENSVAQLNKALDQLLSDIR